MKGDNVNIHISSRTIIMVLVLVAIGFMLFQIRELAPIILSAVVFSLALAPGKRFLARFKIPGPMAVVILYLFVFVILALLLYALFPIVAEQYKIFLTALPNLIVAIQNLLVGTVFEPLIINFDAASVTKYLSNSGGEVLKGFQITGEGILSAFGSLISVVLFFLLTFLFAVNPKAIENFLYVITPKTHRTYIEDLWKRTQTKMGQWFQGQMILVFVITSITYFALLIIGVPNALFLAVFAGLMELIPIFGPVIGGIPAVLMAASTGDITLILLTLLAFVVIQQLENNLIYPLVVSKVVGMSSVLIILAILVGGTLAGFVGILIAVPVAGVLQEFFNDVKTGRFVSLREGE